MKSKLIISFLIIIQVFFNTSSIGEEFEFNSSEIEILEKGNLIKAKDGVEVFSKDGLSLKGKESIYNKEKSILKVIDQVFINDKKNNITINSEEIIYDKKKQIISSIKVNDQTIINDKNNNIIIKADEIIYDKKKQIISSIGNTFAKIKNEYEIKSTELIHDRNLMEIYSTTKTELKDKLGNILQFEEFKFNINKDLLKVKKVSFFDNKNNKIYLDNAIIDLNTYEFLGKNVSMDFDNSLFGNDNNEPRLKGKSITSNSEESTIYKGVFTTCKKNNNKCPPWSMYAGVVKHKKNKKRIEYRNAWLKLYDKPVVYFPYFFHPDPTVKRQSGFLAPGIINSDIFGASVQIPYYKVISANKDLTVTPRFFFNNNFLIQTEYRQANKNSDTIINLGLNRNNNNSNNHFFSNISGSSEKVNFDINLQKVSADNYLKLYKVKSPLIESTSTLNSFITIDKSGEDYSIDTSIEIFEDLTKKDSDKFEYVYPSYRFLKDLGNSNKLNGKLDFKSEGFQKKYNTNVYEASVVNDLKYSSNYLISKSGLKNKYLFLLRNVNTNSKNSSNYKNNVDNKLLSTLLFETRYPLMKKSNRYNNFLTPILSARYSPNKSKNSKNLDRTINFDNIFSLDRIGETDMVEEGQSVTLGVEYSKKDLENNDFLDLSLATVFRDKKIDDLPEKSTIGNKKSNIVGNLNYSPSKFFNLEYEFSLNNNLKRSDYNLVKTNFNINNFVTSFEFLEEDNIVGNKSYIVNKSTLIFDENNSISFKTNKNLDKNITEYYNLIYEYKNDCLTAALEYNKEYYMDNELKPEENLFFSIKIIPFGQINTSSIN